MLKTSYIFFVAIMSATALNAQVRNDLHEESDTVTTLNEITIQGNRIQIPFSKQNRDITIIDQAIISSLPVKSVNELLFYVAGIDVRQRGPWGTQADIRIDGGTFDQTLVLLNGVKITDPQTGHNMMNIPVSLNAINRIEVLKGAAARIYGINALNGAINIITTQPAKNSLDVHLYGGSSFTKDTSNQKLYGGFGLDVAASFSGEKVNHLISLIHAQSSGYRYNTAFNNEKVFYQNSIDLGKERTLSFMGGYVFNDFGANAFYAAPGDKESREIVQTAIGGVNAVLPVNTVWTFRPRISYRYNQDDYIFVRQKPEVYRNIHETNVVNAELNNTLYSGIGDFGLGLEMRNEAINSNSLGKWDRMNYGFFGEYSFNKIDNLLINVGAYTNYNSDFGWQILPGVDIGYTFYKGLRAFVNAGTGQRLPTYTDLYYKGPSNIGNDQLIPEYSVYSEAGLKYNTSRLNASLSYFRRNTSDFIDWVKEEVSDPWQAQNFQEIETRGLSFSADYRLMDKHNSSDVTLLAGISYTWLKPEIKQKESTNKISQYALDNLRNQLTARANAGYQNKYHLTIGAKYQQRFNYDEYILIDTRVAVKLNHFELYADVNNLTDVSYVEAGAVPMVGRWTTVGMKWGW